MGGMLAAHVARASSLLLFATVCLAAASAPVAPSAPLCSTTCWKHLSKAEFPFCQQLAPWLALHWHVRNSTLILGVDATTTGWAAVGLSTQGAMQDADIWALTRNPTSGAWAVTDMHATGFRTPVADASQDVQLVSRPLYSAGNLVAVIKRPLITCDTRQDQPITTFAPQTVIFARGGQPALSYHGRADRGSTNINFSWGPSIATTRSSSSICTGAASQLASGESKLDVLMSRTEVPAKETSYICKMLRIPVDRRRQIIQYEGVMDTQYVHHQVLYRCPRTLESVGLAPSYAGKTWDCTETTSPCREYMAITAPGTAPIDTPPGTGIPVGKGESEFYILEVHYTNPDLKAGQRDSSGFHLTLTTNLRQHDLGVLTLGTYDIAIPPGKAEFAVPPNLCPSACTKKFPWALNVSYTFPHMHQIGKAMYTQHIKTVNGVRTELPRLNYVRDYNFNFQRVLYPEPSTQVIRPGSELYTHCIYTSRSRKNTTYIGIGSNDEMCFSYITYWPRMPKISACFSIHWAPGYAFCGHEDQFTPPDNQKDVEAYVKALTQRGLLVPSADRPAPFKAYSQQCTRAKA